MTNRTWAAFVTLLAPVFALAQGVVNDQPVKGGETPGGGWIFAVVLAAIVVAAIFGVRAVRRRGHGTAP